MNDYKPDLCLSDLRDEHIANLSVCLNRDLKVITRWLASHTPNAETASAEEIYKVTYSLDLLLRMRMSLDIVSDPELNRAYTEHLSHYHLSMSQETAATT